MKIPEAEICAALIYLFFAEKNNNMEMLSRFMRDLVYYKKVGGEKIN